MWEGPLIWEVLVLREESGAGELCKGRGLFYRVAPVVWEGLVLREESGGGCCVLWEGPLVWAVLVKIEQWCGRGLWSAFSLLSLSSHL